MVAQDAKASGALVIEAEQICEGLRRARRSCSDFSLRVMRGDRVGIVGANGAGKTTLINLLTGALAPDSGAVRLGAQCRRWRRLDQRRASLEPTTTLVDALTGGGSDFVDDQRRAPACHRLHEGLPVPPEQARTPIGKLSGGERGRLMLARALAQPSNLMVLDEPTNDLDIETLDLLQELLGDYPGTILLVSHDRDFLDRVATSVIVARGRRALARICRRLFRHGRPARLWAVRPARRDEPAKPEKGAPREAPRAAAKRKLSFNEKHALETLPARIEALRDRDRARSRRSSPTSICTAAIRAPSTSDATSTPRRGPRSSAPRTSGSSWRFYARNSKVRRLDARAATRPIVGLGGRGRRRAPMARKLRVLVGSKKGVFVLHSDQRRKRWSLAGPFCQTWPIHHVVGDPRDGDIYGAGGNEWFGPAVWKSADGGETWSHSSRGLAFGPDETPIKAAWSVATGHGRVYVGVEPASLFASDDGGETGALEGLQDHPCAAMDPWRRRVILHSIVRIRKIRNDLDRDFRGGRVPYRDGGTWTTRNKGTRCRLPARRHALSGIRPVRALSRPARRGGRTGSISRTIAACIAATTAARPGTASKTACRRASAFPSPSIRAIRTRCFVAAQRRRQGRFRRTASRRLAERAIRAALARQTRRPAAVAAPISA